MSDLLDGLDSYTLDRVRPAGRAEWREPLLATFTEHRFSDPGWIFERKLDGVRTIATCDGGTPRLWSRAHKSMDRSYPEIVTALEKHGGSRFVADGEIVAFDGDQTSFSRLRARMHQTDPAEAEHRRRRLPLPVRSVDLRRLRPDPDATAGAQATAASRLRLP